MKIEISTSGYYQDDEAIASIYTDYLMELSSSILSIIGSLLDTLSYKDFIQEARDYLQSIGQPTTGSNVLICSADILDAFKRDFSKLIQIDIESRCLLVSESLFDFEYGTAYKPAARAITSAVDRMLKSLGDD